MTGEETKGNKFDLEDLDVLCIGLYADVSEMLTGGTTVVADPTVDEELQVVVVVDK